MERSARAEGLVVRDEAHNWIHDVVLHVEYYFNDQEYDEARW